MEKQKIEEQLVHSNFSTLKYVVLIAFGFSIFFLIIDYRLSEIWNKKYLSLYRVLDIVFTSIVIIAIVFFWLIKIKKLALKKTVSILFPFLVLQWSAVITGIDFQVFGLSTFLIALLSFSFLLYLRPMASILYFLSSCLVLVISIYLSKGLIENFFPLLILLIPIIIFSVLMTARNYRNKIQDLSNQDKILEMNKDLLYANENLEKEVKKRTHEIQVTLEKAEDSDRLKTAFLQNMSHEIRTPMNAIIGFSKILDKPELSADKRKSYTSIIVNSSNQLLSIVSDILTISSIDTNQEKISFSKVCINNIMLDLLAIFKVHAFNQNISIYTKQHLTDKQSEIYTDRTKFTQILTNLITNALKFTHEGFIEFGYMLEESHGSGTLHNEMPNIPFLQLYVKDTGIGIAPQQQETIFERFRQADLSISRKYGGTGLGLSISKGFVNLLGGEIWVKSEFGKGSTFCFTIPYKPVNESDIILSSTYGQNENHKSILVAEDEEYNYLFIQELLIDMGLKFLHAKDGKQTIDICKADSNVVLVLMDIKMPVMDGYTAAKSIKEFRPNLPIIAQSAYALEHEIEKFNGSAFDDYITKPIDGEELKVKVMKFIDIQRNRGFTELQ
jgi:signal transduction histidine kinase